MIWKIKLSEEADKTLDKLDQQSRKLIQNYLDNKILKLGHPKQLGKSLLGNLRGLWRYRVDKFRIICKFRENELVILVVKIGKRDEVYNN